MITNYQTPEVPLISSELLRAPHSPREIGKHYPGALSLRCVR